MRSPRRKTRSDKFPLTLHPTGQYCKKINGKIHYFGTNKKEALERYLEQATYLHGGQNSAHKASNGSMTLKELCDLYLEYQHSKLLTGTLSARHHNDQISSLGKLMSFFGKGRRIKSISTLDLQNYKRKLQGAYGSAHRLNLHISAMKAMFHWARRNDILENVPNIDAVSRGKIVHQEMYTFSFEQIDKLLSVANVKMKAMTDGSRRYTTVNAVTSMFARLLKKAKINAPKGTGFYTLRRTAATLAARSGDPFAVQRLLGHAGCLRAD